MPFPVGVIDDILLGSIHSAGKGEEEELQRDGHLGHALPWTPGFASRKGLLETRIGTSRASKFEASVIVSLRPVTKLDLQNRRGVFGPRVGASAAQARVHAPWTRR